MTVGNGRQDALSYHYSTRDTLTYRMSLEETPERKKFLRGSSEWGCATLLLFVTAVTCGE
jgi:hypothetical protein